MCWWFALRGHRPDSREDMRFGCVTGGVVGSAAFCLGFFIPIILSPEANQGPLLGILVTGPLGAVIGTMIGVSIAKIRRLKLAG